MTRFRAQREVRVEQVGRGMKWQTIDGAGTAMHVGVDERGIQIPAVEAIWWWCAEEKAACTMSKFPDADGEGKGRF
jgi:hypothetical protein